MTFAQYWIRVLAAVRTATCHGRAAMKLAFS